MLLTILPGGERRAVAKFDEVFGSLTLGVLEGNAMSGTFLANATTRAEFMYCFDRGDAHPFL